MTKYTVPLIKDLFLECSDRVRDVIMHEPEIMQAYFVPLVGGGHALIHGDIGVGKTATVKAMVRAIFGDDPDAIRRADATPDMLPGDIAGSDELNGATVEFAEGPALSCYVFIFDEINRANPKTQSVMLQVMEEHQHSHRNKSYETKDPKFFVVFATQNPRAAVGVFPLPEAMLDRFMICILVKFPRKDACLKIVKELRNATETAEKIKNIRTDPRLDLAALKQIQEVVTDFSLGAYEQWAIDFCRATIPDESDLALTRDYLARGASPRAIRDLPQTARALAVLNGESHLTSKRLEDAAYLVLRHRLVLHRKPRATSSRTEIRTPDEFIKALLKEMPPKA